MYCNTEPEAGSAAVPAGTCASSPVGTPTEEKKRVYVPAAVAEESVAEAVTKEEVKPDGA